MGKAQTGGTHSSFELKDAPRNEKEKRKEEETVKSGVSLFALLFWRAHFFFLWSRLGFRPALGRREYSRTKKVGVGKIGRSWVKKEFKNFCLKFVV